MAQIIDVRTAAHHLGTKLRSAEEERIELGFALAPIETHADREGRMREPLAVRLNQETTTDEFLAAVGANENQIAVFEHMPIAQNSLGIDLVEIVKRRDHVTLKVANAENLDAGSGTFFGVVYAVFERRDFSNLNSRPVG